MPKKNDDSFTVKVEPPAERKKTVPRSAYSATNPSPYAFEAGGPSPNPGGRAGSKSRLLSRALKARLDTRAPDSVASAFQLGRGASWAQVLSAALVTQAVKGDTQAARMVAEYTEPLPKQLFGFDSDDGESSPRLVVEFVQSESDKARDVAAGKIIDQNVAPRDPSAEAARKEATNTAIRVADEPEAAAPQPALPAPAPTTTKQAHMNQPSPWPASPGESRQETRLAAYRRSGLKL
jgi:hypothetical protein